MAFFRMGVESGHKVQLSDLHEHLLCALCGGYLIDATTINICLHSFCRACILHHLQLSPCCPTCDETLDPSHLHDSLRLDETLQTLTYKLVPNLYINEMRKRREFASTNAAAHSPPPRSCAAEPPCGSKANKCYKADNCCRSSRCFIYAPTDRISIGLQHRDRSVMNRLKSRSLHVVPRKATEGCRYLLCPAAVSIRLVKKFIGLKFELDIQHQVELYHSGECLRDSYTLVDIAYIFAWKKHGPMLFDYLIFDENHRRTSKLLGVKHRSDRPQGVTTGSGTGTPQKADPPMATESKMAAGSKMVAEIKMAAESKTESKQGLTESSNANDSKMVAESKMAIDSKLIADSKMVTQSKMDAESKMVAEFGMSLRSLKRGAMMGSGREGLRRPSSNSTHGGLLGSGTGGVGLLGSATGGVGLLGSGIGGVGVLGSGIGGARLPGAGMGGVGLEGSGMEGVGCVNPSTSPTVSACQPPVVSTSVIPGLPAHVSKSSSFLVDDAIPSTAAPVTSLNLPPTCSSVDCFISPVIVTHCPSVSHLVEDSPSSFEATGSTFIGHGASVLDARAGDKASECPFTRENQLSNCHSSAAENELSCHPLASVDQQFDYHASEQIVRQFDHQVAPGDPLFGSIAVLNAQSFQYPPVMLQDPRFLLASMPETCTLESSVAGAMDRTTLDLGWRTAEGGLFYNICRPDVFFSIDRAFATAAAMGGVSLDWQQNQQVGYEGGAGGTVRGACQLVNHWPVEECGGGEECGDREMTKSGKFEEVACGVGSGAVIQEAMSAVAESLGCEVPDGIASDITRGASETAESTVACGPVQVMDREVGHTRAVRGVLSRAPVEVESVKMSVASCTSAIATNICVNSMDKATTIDVAMRSKRKIAVSTETETPRHFSESIGATVVIEAPTSLRCASGVDANAASTIIIVNSGGSCASSAANRGTRSFTSNLNQSMNRVDSCHVTTGGVGNILIVGSATRANMEALTAESIREAFWVEGRADFPPDNPPSSYTVSVTKALGRGDVIQAKNRLRLEHGSEVMTRNRKLGKCHRVGGSAVARCDPLVMGGGPTFIRGSPSLTGCSPSSTKGGSLLVMGDQSETGDTFVEDGSFLKGCDPITDLNLSVGEQFIADVASALTQERSPLITESSHLVTSNSSLIMVNSPVIRENSPLITENNPFITENSLFIKENSLFIKENSPLVKENGPVIMESSPSIAESSPLIITESSPVITNITSLITESSPAESADDPCASDPFMADSDPSIVGIIPSVTLDAPSLIEADPSVVLPAGLHLLGFYAQASDGSMTRIPAHCLPAGCFPTGCALLGHPPGAGQHLGFGKYADLSSLLQGRANEERMYFNSCGSLGSEGLLAEGDPGRTVSASECHIEQGHDESPCKEGGSGKERSPIQKEDTKDESGEVVCPISTGGVDIETKVSGAKKMMKNCWERERDVEQNSEQCMEVGLAVENCPIAATVRVAGSFEDHCVSQLEVCSSSGDSLSNTCCDSVPPGIEKEDEHKLACEASGSNCTGSVDFEMDQQPGSSQTNLDVQSKSMLTDVSKDKPTSCIEAWSPDTLEQTQPQADSTVRSEDGDSSPLEPEKAGTSTFGFQSDIHEQEASASATCGKNEDKQCVAAMTSVASADQASTLSSNSTSGLLINEDEVNKSGPEGDQIQSLSGCNGAISGSAFNMVQQLPSVEAFSKKKKNTMNLNSDVAFTSSNPESANCIDHVLVDDAKSAKRVRKNSDVLDLECLPTEKANLKLLTRLAAASASHCAAVQTHTSLRSRLSRRKQMATKSVDSSESSMPGVALCKSVLSQPHTNCSISYQHAPKDIEFTSCQKVKDLKKLASIALSLLCRSDESAARGTNVHYSEPTSVQNEPCLSSFQTTTSEESTFAVSQAIIEPWPSCQTRDAETTSSSSSHSAGSDSKRPADAALCLTFMPPVKSARLTPFVRLSRLSSATGHQLGRRRSPEALARSRRAATGILVTSRLVARKITSSQVKASVAKQSLSDVVKRPEVSPDAGVSLVDDTSACATGNCLQMQGFSSDLPTGHLVAKPVLLELNNEESCGNTVAPPMTNLEIVERDTNMSESSAMTAEILLDSVLQPCAVNSVQSETTMASMCLEHSRQCELVASPEHSECDACDALSVDACNTDTDLKPTGVMVTAETVEGVVVQCETEAMDCSEAHSANSCNVASESVAVVGDRAVETLKTEILLVSTMLEASGIMAISSSNT